VAVCGTGADGFQPRAFLGDQPQRSSRVPPLPLRLAWANPGCTLRRRICARRFALPVPHARPTCSSASGNGISTVCPSPTPLGLGLGPTHPTWMSLPSEPSAMRGGCLRTSLLLLMPAFALEWPPPPITRGLRQPFDAPLPRRSDRFGIRSFGGTLEPAPAPHLRSSRSDLHGDGDPFSRSYGANLPSSLTRDHSFPLVLLHPATSGGLRYGRTRLPPPSVS